MEGPGQRSLSCVALNHKHFLPKARAARAWQDVRPGASTMPRGCFGASFGGAQSCNKNRRERGREFPNEIKAATGFNKAHCECSL